VVLEALFDETYLAHAANSDIGPLHHYDYDKKTALCLVVGVHVPAVDVGYPVAANHAAHGAGAYEHIREVGVAGLEGT